MKEKKPNICAIWIDAKRAKGIPDREPTGPELGALRNIKKLIPNAAEWPMIFKRFLADDDKFLRSNAHSILWLYGRVDKYRTVLCEPVEKLRERWKQARRKAGLDDPEPCAIVTLTVNVFATPTAPATAESATVTVIVAAPATFAMPDP